MGIGEKVARVATAAGKDSPANSQSRPESVSESYGKRGALCDRTEGDGCVWDKEERMRQVSDLRLLISSVGGTYLHALAAVRTQMLMRKVSEMPAVASIVIDVLAWGLAGPLASIAGKAIKGTANWINDVAPISAGDMRRAAKQAAAAAAKFTTGKVAERGKAHVQTGLEDREADAKADANAYINSLHNMATQTFVALAQQLPANATDEQIVQLLEAFQPHHHVIENYVAELTLKLQRFEESGIAAIGRRFSDRDMEGAVAPRFVAQPEEGKRATYEVVRDTRVVWHEYVSGYPRDLVVERHDGHKGFSFEEAQELLASKQPGYVPKPMTFGPRDPITALPETGGVVPDELREYALARHTAAWGVAPETRLVDDSNSFDPMRVAAAVRAKKGNRE